MSALSIQSKSFSVESMWNPNQWLIGNSPESTYALAFWPEGEADDMQSVIIDRIVRWQILAKSTFSAEILFSVNYISILLMILKG